jgi:hypothetical protein
LQSQSSWASSVAASVFASVTRKHLSVGRRRARRYLHHANDAKAKLAAAKKKTICKNDLKKANLTLATKQNCLDFSTFYFYFDSLFGLSGFLSVALVENMYGPFTVNQSALTICLTQFLSARSAFSGFDNPLLMVVQISDLAQPRLGPTTIKRRYR